ncbi:MAG: HEAT repeat domain-containing protein [candidate division Zixibacteria bacterium]
MERNINLSEKNLQTDIKSLTREIVHELFLICRKAGIYAIDHPMILNGLSKPFLGLQRLFGFKKYFILYFTEGRLYANNILMADAGAVNYLKDKMHELDIKSIAFDENLTAGEFTAFIERFVGRINPSHPDYAMESYLERLRISTILINSPLIEKLYNTGLRYREVQLDDFSVRRMVTDYLSGDINLAVKMLAGGYMDTGNQAEDSGIDYHKEIVQFILPEKFSELQSSELLSMALRILEENPYKNDELPDELIQLIHSFNFHPRRDELTNKIQSHLMDQGYQSNILENCLSVPASIMLETVQDIDRIGNDIYSEKYREALYGEFRDAFIRLLRTRQIGKAASISEKVVNYLASDTAIYRQHSICLLKDIIATSITAGENEFLNAILRYMQSLFTRGLESFEFSEVAFELLNVMISMQRYKAVAEFLNVLSSSRRYENGVLVYDSVTVRRIFEVLDNKELISQLIRGIQTPNGNLVKQVRDILIALQSEEVALQLAEIVIHPNRQIRQHCLKILSESGQPAVKVFSDILRDEKYFMRPFDRRELPDEKWYLIRNAIFVLGNLGDKEACDAFRFRLSDSDVRVRLEMVRALEKIDANESVDLLMLLAEDPDSSVREAAIIVLGLKKRSDLFPFYVDLIGRQKGEADRIINALALTGSLEARDYLWNLLQNDQKLKELSSGKLSVNLIQSAIIKALEKIGDDEIIKKLENYKPDQQNNISKTAKIFLNKLNLKQ